MSRGIHKPKFIKAPISIGNQKSEQANPFALPKLAHLTDPFEIPSLHEAVNRICKAIKNKENILVIGDYDDGITSTVIIKKYQFAFGLNPLHVTPKEKTEGYGLTQKVLDRGLQLAKIDLVIVLDCGTNSKDEANF